MNVVNSFNNAIKNIKEMITNFKDKNHKSKKYKNFKTLNTKLELVDTVLIIRATITSIKFSITGIGLNFLILSTGIGCAPSLGNNLLYNIIINKKENTKNNKKEIKTQIKLLIIDTGILYKIL